jgi:hypothetical protein
MGGVVREEMERQTKRGMTVRHRGQELEARRDRELGW